MTAPIPATIITGFLGAGKTTLIQNLIRSAGGKRIALIVNEFGDLGFDGEQIAGCGIEGCADEDVVELTNGCICCTVADDFLPTMEMLLARDPAPEHIVIETSGLALPQPLVQAFNWPSVAARTTVDGVVTVADAEALARGLYATDSTRLEEQRAADESLDHETPIEELFADQMRCADLIVLSKTDRLEADDHAKAEAALTGRREGVGLVRSTADGLPASLLIGLGASSQQDMTGREASHHHGAIHDHVHESAPLKTKDKSGVHEGVRHAHEHDHAHDHHHHPHHHDHDHDSFASAVIAPPVFASKPDLESYVARLCALPGVLRVKGMAEIAGKAAPVVVQAVGPRVSSQFDMSGRPHKAGLVVIGLAPLPDLAAAMASAA